MLKLEAQEITTDVLTEKYLKEGETNQYDLFKRVAKGIAQAEKEELRDKYEQIFYNNMLEGGIGAGRIMSAAGTNLSASLINCFVIDVGDSIEGVDEDGHPGIYESVKYAACTMRKGGGVGYNFSKIRPKGSEIKSLDSTASGPCSYMDVFDASCLTIESAGCFAGDTLIDTTEGLIPIKEIVESNKDYYAITHVGPKKITTKFKTGIKPIWNVKTEFGVNVRVTKDHKFAQYKDGEIVTISISEIVESDNKSLILLETIQDENEIKFSRLLDTVISEVVVEPEEETYDLEVEDVHLLSGNGIYSSNSRRGAQLAALNIDHPDILEFIKAKRTKGRWNNFNISVLVPDRFMKAKENDEYIELVHKAKPGKEQIKNGAYQREDGKWVYGKIKAKELWDTIMKSNYDYAEPGILFEDNINGDNNLRYIEYIDTTNPCVTGDTLVLTKLGYVSIESLVDKEVEVWNGYEWSFVTPKVTGENKEIYEVKLSDGSYLLCTPNHKFVLSNNTKVSADELNLGDTLLKSTYPVIDTVADDCEEYTFNKNEVPTAKKSLNYRLLWLGDCIDIFSIKYNNNIKIISKDERFLRKVKYMLNTLGCNGVLETEYPYSVNVLTIYGNDINSLKKLGLKTKTIDLDNISNNKNTSDLTVVSKQKLSRIEPKVYCFTEPKNHTGVFNGIMTGNCGEQPLPVNGCCDLGPIILPKLVSNPFTDNASFDFDKLENIVKTQVRFLDNVLDVTNWALEEQKIEAHSKRRIGVGFTGLANAIAMMNKVYYSEDGLELARKIVNVMRDTAYNESVNLAIEKGPFPLFNADKYLEEGTFASRLPDYIKDRIRANGIRNSHLLSVAPTGTVSLAFADNASNGIEPPFSLAYTRKKRTTDGGHRYYNVLDHSFRVWLTTQEKEFANAIEEAVCNYKDKFTFNDKEYIVKDVLPKSLVTALEMTPDQHLSMMRTVQPYIDSSCSKTVNIPADYPFEDFQNVYDLAWKYKLKGVSTYRPNNILGSVLSVSAPEPTESVTKDTTNIDNNETIESIVKEMYSQPFESREDGALPGISVKGRFYTNQGEQKFIITINFLTLVRHTKFGNITIRRPIEFLLTSNFTTSSSAWDASMRFLSLMARSGVSMVKAIENLREITWEHGNVKYGTRIKDGRKISMWHSSDAAAIGYIIEEALIKDGYLTNDGKLALNYKIDNSDIKTVNDETKTLSVEVVKEVNDLVPTGSKCPECGAYNLIKKDGCTFCENCGYIGNCG